MQKVCILLTATISPNENTPDLSRPNPLLRELDYLNALKKYLGTGLPIIFCENSNTKSDKILALTKGLNNFEYLCFQSTQKIQGKGYGEKEILDYAFENSLTINSVDWVIKIAGRYEFDNIADIITNVKTKNADVIVNFGRNLSWVDTRIMFLKKDFYFKYFKPYLERYLDDEKKIYFEKVFARSVHQLIADGGTWLPSDIYPFYRGVSAWNSENLKFNFFRKIKFRIYYKFKKWIFKQHA